MSVEIQRDPRFGPFQQVKRKSTTDMELKRVKWDHSTLTASFKAIEKSFVKKFKANDFETKKSLLPSNKDPQFKTGGNVIESSPSAHCNATNKISVVTNYARPSLLLEITWKNEIKRLPAEHEEKAEKRNKMKDKILMAESTHLEHYLMRIHELVRMASDENYVERECKKLLSTMVKRVAIESEDEYSSRRI